MTGGLRCLLFFTCFVLSSGHAVSSSESDVSSAPEDAAPIENAAALSRFEAVHVYIDPMGEPMAAYQFELSAENAQLTVVGLENGGHPAFAEPPYFDRGAVEAGKADRLIVAAFSLLPDSELPRKRTRVATVMVRVKMDGDGDSPNQQPEPVRYLLALKAASNAAGTPIEVKIHSGDQP